MGMASCNALLQFVTSSDVVALKARLNPYVTGLNASVAACGAKVDAGTLAAFNAFVTAWDAYNAAEEGFLTAGSEFNAGCDYQQQIKDWQDTLGGLGCSSVGPAVNESNPSPVLGTALKWGAIGLVAAVGLFALAPLVELGVETKAASAIATGARRSAAATKRLYQKARSKPAAA